MAILRYKGITDKEATDHFKVTLQRAFLDDYSLLRARKFKPRDGRLRRQRSFL